MALLVGLSGQAGAQAPMAPPAPAPVQPPAQAPMPLPPPSPVPPPPQAPLPPPPQAPLPPPAQVPGPPPASAAPSPDESGELFGPLPSREATQLKAETANPRWRRLAFGVTAGAAGLALIGGLSLKVVESQKYREFNAFEVLDPEGDGPSERCSVDQKNNGPPGCAEMLSDGQRAGRWGNVGFVLAGAFAVTAVVLKLTTPTESSAAPTQAARPATLACAPGLGAATCRLTF